MDHPFQLPACHLHQQDGTGNFQPAAGGAGAGAQEHEDEQDVLGQLRPQVEIGGSVAGGGDDGGDLEGGLSDDLLQGVVLGGDADAHQDDGHQDDAQVRPQLGAAQDFLELFAQCQIVHVEVDPKEGHKDGGDPL